MSCLTGEASGSFRRGRCSKTTQFGDTFLGKGQIYTCLCVSEGQRQAVSSNLC